MRCNDLVYTLATNSTTFNAQVRVYKQKAKLLTGVPGGIFKIHICSNNNILLYSALVLLRSNQRIHERCVGWHVELPILGRWHSCSEFFQI